MIEGVGLGRHVGGLGVVVVGLERHCVGWVWKVGRDQHCWFGVWIQNGGLP